MHVFPDAVRSNAVRRALQDQRWDAHCREIGAVVREKGDASEMLGDRRVGPAKTLGKLGGKFRSIIVLHNHRRHGARPAEMIIGKRLQEAVDIAPVEAANVRPVVDVAG